MIVIRQRYYSELYEEEREYSSLAKKILYKSRRAGRAIKSAVIDGCNSKGVKSDLAKNRIKDARAAIKDSEDIPKAIVKKANETIEAPGEKASSVIKFVGERPLSAASIPTPVPTALVLSAEDTVKKFGPYRALSRVTGGVADTAGSIIETVLNPSRIVTKPAKEIVKGTSNAVKEVANGNIKNAGAEISKGASNAVNAGVEGAVTTGKELENTGKKAVKAATKPTVTARYYREKARKFAKNIKTDLGLDKPLSLEKAVYHTKRAKRAAKSVLEGRNIKGVKSDLAENKIKDAKDAVKASKNIRDSVRQIPHPNPSVPPTR